MTREDYFRFRTNTTGLSDDELLLLDALFSLQGGQRSAFFAENLSWHLNTKIRHGMTDEQLSTKLDDWEAQGWLAREDGEDEPHFQLTERGMGIWESERLPVWDCFLTESFSNWDSAGRGWLEISSPSRRLAYKNLHALQKARLYKTARRPRSIWRRGWDEKFGKTLPRVCTLRIRARDLSWRGASVWPDWRVIEEAQFWWNDAAGLAWLRLEGRLPWRG